MAVTKYVRRVKYAPAKVVERQIAEWNERDPSIVRCRSLWHAWELYTVLDNGRELAEVLRCQRGHGYKYRVLNSRNGAVITGWTPVLDKGYYMPPGAGRISQANMNSVRLAAVRSFSTETSRAEGNIYDLVRSSLNGSGESTDA